MPVNGWPDIVQLTVRTSPLWPPGKSAGARLTLSTRLSGKIAA
mgnify:CR=1 FL=1